MWFRSEALTEYLMAAESQNSSIYQLTKTLNLDEADLPLLMAVAATHSPHVVHRFPANLE